MLHLNRMQSPISRQISAIPTYIAKKTYCCSTANILMLSYKSSIAPKSGQISAVPAESAKKTHSCSATNLQMLESYAVTDISTNKRDSCRNRNKNILTPSYKSFQLRPNRTKSHAVTDISTNKRNSCINCKEAYSRSTANPQLTPLESQADTDTSINKPQFLRTSSRRCTYGHRRILKCT